MRNVLYQQPLAGRDAYQFHYNQKIPSPSQKAGKNGSRRQFRRSYKKRNSRTHEGKNKTRKEPGRYQGPQRTSGNHFHHRYPQGSDHRSGSPQDEHTNRRRRGYKLQSPGHRLPDSRQRRRHPCDNPFYPDHIERGCRSGQRNRPGGHRFLPGRGGIP